MQHIMNVTFRQILAVCQYLFFYMLVNDTILVYIISIYA